MKFEAQQSADTEIRRDRIILVAANPDGATQIFQTYKTSSEAKLKHNPTPDAPIEEVPDDPELAKILQQIASVGFAISEV